MPDASNTGVRLAELAQRVGARLAGDGDLLIVRVATLEHAGPQSISFLANPRYRAKLATTRAAAVIVSPEDAAATPLPKLIDGNPYATFAKVAAILHPPAPRVAAIHPSAQIDGSARVAKTAVIGACAVIGANATVGERAVIGAHCIVGEEATVGDDTVLHPGAILYARTIVGDRSTIHSGAVIGADGFGIAEEAGRWVRIPQLGRVVIGADVEVGANTTIDRGAIDDTIIENDVKLDNQIQIGHNCLIGAHTAIAGCVGIAGSVRIGRNCRIGGAAMISGHLEIGDGTVISGGTLVYDSIRQPGIYTGVFPMLLHAEWKRVALQVRRLRELAERVRTIERKKKVADDGRGSV
ncbi:MAG TPA: UDP-3-O-(3-hydroxymyristoyl)glucosamine N-acyltransferase [Casimicrobiaceae bacterium]